MLVYVAFLYLFWFGQELNSENRRVKIVRFWYNLNRSQTYSLVSLVLSDVMGSKPASGCILVTTNFTLKPFFRNVYSFMSS